MSFYVKTTKTADTTGYVQALPEGGCSSLAIGAESGECWVEPLTNQTSTPADPTNALIASVAGVGGSKGTIHLTAGASRVLDLTSGYGGDNTGVRFTHYRIWSVSAGLVEVLGS